MVKAQIN